MKIDGREIGRQRKREVEILNQTGFLKELSFISVQKWTRASQVAKELSFISVQKWTRASQVAQG